MADYAALRNGLRTRLATISGLNAYAKPVGTPVLPAAIVVPGQIEFDETMGRGVDRVTYDVLVLVAMPLADMAAEDLDPYLAGSGASSIKAAIEGDGTLGGAAQWTRVLGVSAYGDVEYSGKVYLGARFPIEIQVAGA